jgi:hypothetical protein
MSTSGSSSQSRPRRRASPGKVNKSPMQKQFEEDCISKVESGSARDFYFHPPEASMRRGIFSSIAFTLASVIVWMPHFLWKHLRVPSQPPCPRCGFEGEVKAHGRAPARRFSGLSLGDCGWIVGSVHRCMTCFAKREHLKSDGQPYKHITTYFRSFNPDVTAQYASHPRWSFIARVMPLYFTHRRAVTRALVDTVNKNCAQPNGSNPTALAKLFTELYHLGADRKRLVMLLVQRIAGEKPVGGVSSVSDSLQPTIGPGSFGGGHIRILRDVWLDKKDSRYPQDLSLADLGANGAPTHSYLRALFLAHQKDSRDFNDTWTMLNVGGRILSADHHCKALKCQIFKIGRAHV